MDVREDNIIRERIDTGLRAVGDSLPTMKVITAMCSCPNRHVVLGVVVD
jgi:hypothetical protein